MSKRYAYYCCYNVFKLVVVLTIVVLSTTVQCAFFDLTDVDDPLALLWNTKDAIIHHKNRNCEVTNDGHIITGQCKHPSHCLLSGGKLNGLCGVLSTCCTYDTVTCAKSTNAKISYFESGDDVLSNTDCHYTVHAMNENICQVRLDFEIFKLTNTKSQSLDTTLASYAYQCTDDQFTVKPNQYDSIPVLCGYNTGQHLYIRLDSSVRQVDLYVHLADRVNFPGASADPQWRIKVTQLECPGSLNIYKHKNNNLGNDFPLLAPDGVIQYFTEPIGRVVSFNFNPLERTGSYVTGSDYAIGFKRPINVCQLKFKNNYIFLPSVQALTPTQCLSYLFVPGLNWNVAAQPPFEAQPLNEICNSASSVLKFLFYMTTKGPFYLELVTQPHEVETARPYAFDVNYEYVPCIQPLQFNQQ